MRTPIFVAICLAMVFAFASGQDHPNIASSDIDRSVEVVDVSVHSEVDAQAHDPNTSGFSAKLPMSLRFKKPAARSVVWPHTVIAVPDATSQTDKLTFDSLSFQPTVQAPIAAVWPGLTSAAAADFATGRPSKTLELHPKLFGALPAYVTNNGLAPSLGLSAVFPPSSPLHETRGTTGRFGRNEPAEASYSFFPEMTFSRPKGQIGTRKRKRPERKIANSAGVVASPKSLVNAKR